MLGRTQTCDLLIRSLKRYVVGGSRLSSPKCLEGVFSEVASSSALWLHWAQPLRSTHILSQRDQVAGPASGPGIESSPWAAFHFATNSSSSSMRERGSLSSVKNVPTWLSNP